MAQITRRIWSELATEAILAGGGHTYTGYSTRMNYWLTEAYYDICAMYHHYELDAKAFVTVPAGSKEVTVPPNCYVVIGLSELDANDAPKRFLMSERPQIVMATQRVLASSVRSYARIGNTLLLDAALSTAAKYQIDYYRTPVAPDFAATSGQPNSVPETSWLWDTHLIDAALAKSKRRIWRPDLAAFDAQDLMTWLGEQIQSQMKEDPIMTEADKPTVGRPLGGKQQ